MRSYTWTNNALAGAAGYPYPIVTWMPTVDEFRAQFRADYSLTANSVFRRLGTDGLDLGFDWVSTGSADKPVAPRNLRLATKGP
jgi:hypothetical protein